MFANIIICVLINQEIRTAVKLTYRPEQNSHLHFGKKLFIYLHASFIISLYPQAFFKYRYVIYNIRSYFMSVTDRFTNVYFCVYQIYMRICI